MPVGKAESGGVWGREERLEDGRRKGRGKEGWALVLVMG